MALFSKEVFLIDIFTDSDFDWSKRKSLKDMSEMAKNILHKQCKIRLEDTHFKQVDVAFKCVYRKVVKYTKNTKDHFINNESNYLQNKSMGFFPFPLEDTPEEEYDSDCSCSTTDNESPPLMNLLPKKQLLLLLTQLPQLQ